MGRARNAKEVLSLKLGVIPFEGAWADAFGQPEDRGTWFIWGKSGNGKSSFVMQLCKELCRYETVVLNSLEEGFGLTMQHNLKRHGMASLGKRFQLLEAEPMEELVARLARRKSPKIVVIDSLQYTGMKFLQYQQLKQRFPDKIFIFTSHATGDDPLGSLADRVRYDAALKIHVKSFMAICNGRTFGPKGKYVIWEEGAALYWGEHTLNEVKAAE